MLLSSLRALSRSQASSIPRRAISSTSPSLSTVSRLGRDYVEIHFASGARSVFHTIWLKDNDASAKEASSRQKMRAITEVSLDVIALDARVDGSDLIVQWDDKSVSRFDLGWLHAHRYDDAALREARERSRPRLWTGSELSLPVFEHEDLLRDDRHVWEWAKALSSIGLAKVVAVPRTREAFIKIVSRLGQLKRNMYGDVFDVISVPEPINVAYTALELPAHMDLCYYEAVPGLQFLHALTFPSEVSGGLSTFYDGFKIAEDFRTAHPADFHILASQQMTFFKEDSCHHQLYRRPLIVLDEQGDIVSLNYSPPWEAPLRIPADLVRSYYAAYQRYTRYVNDPKYRFAFRLKEGELISFNNRRIYHGRTQFGNEGHRHLQGCYVDTDDFSNTWRVLKRRFAANDLSLEFPRMGNHS